MKINQISELIRSIRDELNLSRGIVPEVVHVYTHDDDTLHLITTDRAEKSLVLGPGGRIIAELAKRSEKKITVYGADELLLRKHRLNLTKERINEISPYLTDNQKIVVERIQSLVNQELSFPERMIEYNSSFSTCDVKVALAFSGGVDSSATGKLLLDVGAIPDALMVELDYRFVNPPFISHAEEWCKHNQMNLVMVPVGEDIDQVLIGVDEGRIHPCGKCHSVIMEKVRTYAITNGYHVLVTGELLPSGRQSIVLDDGLLIIHLPAALALSKYRTESIAETSGRKLGRRRFGCNLVAATHSKGWKQFGPSIFRVLRELEAGVLTTGQALEYIKDIIPYSIKKSGE
jgi:predicted PP-loop superfamily ATPase